MEAGLGWTISKIGVSLKKINTYIAWRSSFSKDWSSALSNVERELVV